MRFVDFAKKHIPIDHPTPWKVPVKTKKRRATFSGFNKGDKVFRRSWGDSSVGTIIKVRGEYVYTLWPHSPQIGPVGIHYSLLQLHTDTSQRTSTW